MKCTNCQQDSSYSERSSGKCPKCGTRFAFEPKNGDPFTDAMFQHAISVISRDNTVRFTPLHLYYQLCRQKRSSDYSWIGVLVAAFFIFIALIALLYLAFLALTPLLPLLPAFAPFFPIFSALCISASLAVPATAFALYRVRPGRPTLTPISLSGFQSAWKRWQQVRGKPKALISTRTQVPTRSKALETELQEYSFDRAVICDRPELVDTLLANQFHLENNCAILGVEGYPEASFEIVRRMLRNNPKLLILAVHDASEAGCRLATRLSTDPEWFPNKRILDIGLRPEHARFFKGQLLARPHPVKARPGITRSEAAWLSRYTLEATAIPPEQLIKRLYRAFTLGETDSSTSIDTNTVLVADAGTSDGGSDSFG